MYETGAVWTLTGSDGTSASFNSGGALYLEEVTGFDSPNVRENVEDLPEWDGAAAGDFYFGSRPVTLSGRIVSSTATARNAAVVSLQRACRGLRASCTIVSQPQGLPNMQIAARVQNLRVTGGFVKQFQIGLICPNPLIVSVTENTTSRTNVGSITPSNAGNFSSFPRIRITGPITNPTVTNATTGAVLSLTGTTIAAAHYIEVDMANRTALSDLGINSYKSIVFPTTTFPASLAPGSNTLVLAGTGATGSTALQVWWRDTWA